MGLGARWRGCRCHVTSGGDGRARPRVSSTARPGPRAAGARHHQLPASYQEWLEAQPSYAGGSMLGKLATAGTVLGAATLLAPFSFAGAAYRYGTAQRGASGEDGSTDGLAAVAFDGLTSTFHEATRLAWWTHDTVLKPIGLGSGCTPPPSPRATRQPRS